MDPTDVADPATHSPLARYLGVEPARADGEATVARLVIRPEHGNLTGAVHGGTMLALADNTATRMALRANADGPNAEKFMVGIDLHAVFLRNQQGGEIQAEARVIRVGARVTVVHTVVTGTDDKVLAEFTSTHIPA